MRRRTMRNEQERRFVGPLLPVLLGLMLVALPKGLRAEEAEQGGRPLVASYIAIWDASKDAVDVAWVRLRALEAMEGGRAQERAFAAIEEKLGLTREDLAPSEPRELRRFRRRDDLSRAATAGLRVYGDILQRAVEGEVPLILERREGDDQEDRRNAVEYLAGVARHRGFLPLLKTVAANPEEHPRVRGAALGNIGYIPDDDVVPYYIEKIYDAERARRDPKNDRLATICAESMLRAVATQAFFPQGSAQERQEQWRKWWEEHKATWQYPGQGVFLRFQ
jgi:hypothetical protein